MPTLVRKQVYLEAKQDRRIKRRAKAEGVAEAVVIRRAIDVGLDRLGSVEAASPSARAAAELLRGIDRLIAKGPVPGGRSWRREDLYDRGRR